MFGKFFGYLKSVVFLFGKNVIFVVFYVVLVIHGFACFRLVVARYNGGFKRGGNMIGCRGRSSFVVLLSAGGKSVARARTEDIAERLVSVYRADFLAREGESYFFKRGEVGKRARGDFFNRRGDGYFF